MSVAPLPPTTSGAAAPGSTGAGTTTDQDGGFAALVAALLGGRPQPTVGQPPTAPATGEEPADGEAGAEGPADGSGDTAPLPVIGIPVLAAPPVLRPETAPGSAPRAELAAVAGPATPQGGGPEATTQPPEPPPAVSPAPAVPAPVAATALAHVPPTPAPGTSETRPAPVVAQLAPEVTRLVSQGDGVHRITMRLQPEALGEVRVTLTVRDGEVHVRLAAGDRAQQALLEGAPELRRVLEMTGATETRVVVRDLAGGLATGSPNASSTPAPGGGGGGGDTPAPGQGHAGTPDQHARTRGGPTAKDGLTDGTPTSCPEPARRSPRGVDLTM